MKKNFRLILLLIIFISLSACIVDDSWLGIVGRWQDIEYPDMEIEFRENGTFYDYFYGEVSGSGDFIASGSKITLEYNPPCVDDQCSVTLKYTVTDDTLIITDTYGDFVFRKVD